MDKEFYMTPDSEESNLVLKQALKELIEDMYEKNIISGLLEDGIDSQSFEELVLSLRDKLKECYPKTKLKRMMKSIHYANGFEDKSLKESAFLLDEIEQYLSSNRFLDHDQAVKYFNDRITADDFEINPQSLVLIMIESLHC
ncbi:MULTISPECIES: hypothetical protein [unclassified Streptococcus]|jgi:hypothetical protein|uniref:hypothetical protein n=1 Tax=unclassified Streptococcus TaxID=2608887 RepID=UPI0015BAF4FE|nr:MULTISPECIES: hypothetical protein [unclassified Streptococcus]MCP9015700.1 hypothetical protein [Streptococcus sp. CF8_St5-17]QLF55590.1 hypothetical protein HW271_04675 [Streptococcus sp. oral taxon 061]